MGSERGHILVVDDHRTDRLKLCLGLQQQGHAVDEAEDGVQALHMLRAHSYDLVLLDIVMPEMDGYQVLEQMKEDDVLRDVPVLVISAYDDIDRVVKGILLGAEDYLPKPFDPVLLRARIGACLEKKRLRDQERKLQKQLQDANETMRRELALAMDVQASFLPRELPDIPGWQLAVTLRPARETSGDFYDVSVLPNGWLGILVADVAGKGAAAALFMALSWSLIRTYAVEYPTQPELALRAANRRILTDTRTNRFVTVFYGILDPVTGRLVYCNAGHCPPLLFRARKSKGFQALVGAGTPLGIVTEGNWEQGAVDLTPSDVLVMYTDGITEARNQEREFFDQSRLLETVAPHVGHPAHEIQDAILQTVYAFTGDLPQTDDIALAVVVRE
jgi:sigma-B regulation protein RsbU (phosphoserine phosphatase)